MDGMLGKKIGMTRVFGEDGQQIPVTVIQVGPCVVVQRKTQVRDGYEAVKLGFEDRRPARATKAAQGEAKAAGTAPKHHLHEFAVGAEEISKPGDSVTAALFESVPFVDVTGITKGRGFQGVVRRYRMAGGPMTHGGHSKRRIGSIGCRTSPGTVHRGKRMPGHMGNVQTTMQNLRVVQVRSAENLLLVRGAVPGPTGAILVVRKALKKAGKGT
jgi:large subunit ribosomal protein L3